MRIGHLMVVGTLVAGIGGMFVPARAQTQGDTGSTPDQGMGQMKIGGHMGHGMMSRDGMSNGMMSGGCASMMQSMGGGGRLPNSQWQAHPPGDATPD
ncbi:hypothetical protein [Acidisoma sp. S159]|uniref:hypothetical protein n=1 Tax=Acidisoma sp. S159 TaxID=1747225 RepID=UPI00131E1860|nr:hypothetical protein [Acidisoma sp. S159]